MSIVQINQGDSVLVPTGEKINGVDQVLVVPFDIIQKLVSSEPVVGKKYRTSKGGVFSKVASLVCRAINTGSWTTGAAVSVPEVLETLYKSFASLSLADYEQISGKGFGAVVALAQNGNVSMDDRIRLREIANKIQADSMATAV